MTLQEEALRRTETLVLEIENQSDRGTAIIGAAWVEEEIEAAIESFLHHDKKSWDRLFNKSGPLGTFSAKIDLALLLGMCSKNIASDLHIMREIRNEFAHSVAAKDHSALTFKSQHISDKCLALKCVAHENHTEPRHAFVRACAVLNADFYTYRFLGQKVSDGGLVRAVVERVA